jgi:heme exporter protein D
VWSIPLFRSALLIQSQANFFETMQFFVFLCVFTSVVVVSAFASSVSQSQEKLNSEMKKQMREIFEKFGKNVTGQANYSQTDASNLWVQSNVFDKASCAGTNYVTSSVINGECIEDMTRITCLSNGI